MNTKEIKSYLVNGKWNWLIDNYPNDNELAEVLYERLKERYNYQGNREKTIKVIKNSVSKYKSKKSNVEEIVDSLCSDLEDVADFKSNNFTGYYTNNSSSGSGRNINMDTDTLDETMKKNKEIKSDKENTSIEAPGYVGNVFSEYADLILEQERELDKCLEDANKEIIDTLERINVVDAPVAEHLRKSLSFDQLISVISMNQQTGSKIKLADKSTFEKSGCTVIGNKVVMTDSDGVKYEYDINTNMLTDSKGNSLEVRYFVPSNGDVSLMNTVTCLSGQNESDMYSTTGANSFYFNDISSNAILIVPEKKYKSGVDLNKASFSYMGDEVISSTKFAKLFSHQKEECSNIILGCSNGGGSALKIAANAGGLYDNVISINYALVTVGQGKGVNPGDDNRLTIEEVKMLKDKNILFISVDDDPNLKGGKESNVYVGLTNLLKHCPDANVSFITNSSSSIYSGIDGKNYKVYGIDTWSKIFDKSYSGHGAYHKVFRDLVNSGIFG